MHEGALVKATCMHVYIKKDVQKLNMRENYTVSKLFAFYLPNSVLYGEMETLQHANQCRSCLMVKHSSAGSHYVNDYAGCLYSMSIEQYETISWTTTHEDEVKLPSVAPADQNITRCLQ